MALADYFQVIYILTKHFPRLSYLLLIPQSPQQPFDSLVEYKQNNEELT